MKKLMNDAAEARFPNLSAPFQIGNMRLKNRMVFPPMNTNFSNESGAVTAQMEEYYVRRAMGGVGLIVLEAVSVVEYSKNHGVQPMLYDNKFVPALANLVDRVHVYGAKISVEIAHYGGEAGIGRRVSASNITTKDSDVEELRSEGIAAIVSDFVKAVKYARVAGFDAVTLHAAHGYFLGEFLSPLYNRRTDAYGGNTENRVRIIKEIVQRTKEEVGTDFPIMARISADEFIVGGVDSDEAVAIAKEMEKHGISAIDVSAGIPASVIFCFPPYNLPGYQGQLVPLAERIKNAVDIPVICACGIREPRMSERILERGQADLIALGRTLIADPDFCNKALAGQEDIRPCLSCEYCAEMLETGKSIRCAVNAEAGREYALPEVRTKFRKKKVFVVGAGPAGLEAARTAASFGHDVTVFERERQAGGTLNCAKLPPGKEKIDELIRWFEKQLEYGRVTLKLETEFAEENHLKEPPDALIFANGSIPAKLGSGDSRVFHVNDILLHPEKAKGRIVILGGGSTGCEAAEFLAGERVEVLFHRKKDLKGEFLTSKVVHEDIPKRDISIVEMIDDICMDMEPYSRSILMTKLRENDVKLHTKTRVLTLLDGGVQVEHAETKKHSVLPADTIIVAFGGKPRENGLKVLKVKQVFSIGDCDKVGKIADAVRDGYFAAHEI
jgi:2,4-dienoyl-CoA reductase-like NADH-dependent reductase (Old Yellow Enzyme family)/thioredoxin reductase